MIVKHSLEIQTYHPNHTEIYNVYYNVYNVSQPQVLLLIINYYSSFGLVPRPCVDRANDSPCRGCRCVRSWPHKTFSERAMGPEQNGADRNRAGWASSY